MSERKSIHGEWSSGLAFFLAATGSAVGLGNIWKFPSAAAASGGGAFVLLYLACIGLIGLPILIAEIALGRCGRASPVTALYNLALQEGRCSAWGAVGFVGMAAGVIILALYSVVAGWSLNYLWWSLHGSYAGATEDQVNRLFTRLTANPWRQMIWYTLFLVVTLSFVAAGVRKGLERAVRVMVPLLGLLLVLLVIYALFFGDAGAGLFYLLRPNFGQINSHALLMAMGHSFFTLSLGIGAMLVYGAYMPESVSIARMSLWIALVDTAVGLLAGTAILPLLMAKGVTPMQGPALIFAALPFAFGGLPLGSLAGAAFFAMLVLAAWTSAIAMIEPTIAWLVERRYRRGWATLGVGIVVWLFGMVIDYSFNIWSGVTWQGRTLFELFNFVSSDIMLPTGGFLMVMFAGWMMSERSLRRELRMNRLLFRIWLTVLRYVTPVGVLLVFLNGLGLIRGVL